MSTIFGDVRYPIRTDLDQATRKAWTYLGQPGNWWTGVQRVDLVAEVRAARDCTLCAERQHALSPTGVKGDHDTASDFPPVVIEAAHRLTNDASRLSEKTIRGWNAEGLSDGAYVELVSIVSTVIGVDAFCDALEIPLLPLPQAQSGEPSRYIPEEATQSGAWFPMISPASVDEKNTDLYEKFWRADTPNVIRAMSLVPDAVRNLLTLLQPFYIGNLTHPDAGNCVDESQVELVAARVSAINQCFY